MLKEGTIQRTSAEIAEIIDFYGGTLSTPVSLDTANIVLYSLSKHFDKLLPLVSEILKTPAFPEEELNAYIKNCQQNLKVNLTKTDVVAYREITERIFGSNHPYGYNSSFEMMEQLTRADLEKHFKEQYNVSNCLIIISGKTDEQTLDILDKHLGRDIPLGKQKKVDIPDLVPTPQQIKIPLKDSVQTAIRIGRKIFNKQHEDYHGFFVLNAILGGYFGSRLMMNIREDKGYTYNIFSAIDAMVHDGYFYIGTEVGNEFVDKTLEEVFQEIKKLQTELIKEEELEMVRSYLLGNMLTFLDGPMNVSDIVKTIVTENLQFTDFQDLVKVIKNITAEEIRHLAQKYLQKEDLWQVIVGA